MKTPRWAVALIVALVFASIALMAGGMYVDYKTDPTWTHQ